MDALHALIPIAGTIGAAIALCVLAASMPESAAWCIGRWLDLWAWLRTNRRTVRERLGEVEADFWDGYKAELADGSSTTRATFRALWFVRWELARAPAIAAAADDLATTKQVPRNLFEQRLTIRIKLLHLVLRKMTVGPIALTLILSLTIPALGVRAIQIIGAVQEPTIDYPILITRCAIVLVAALWILKVLSVLRRRGSFTSKASKCFPLRSTAFVTSYVICCLAGFSFRFAEMLLPSVYLLLTTISLVGMISSAAAILGSLMNIEMQRIWLRGLLDEVSEIEGNIFDMRSRTHDKVTDLRFDTKRYERTNKTLDNISLEELLDVEKEGLGLHNYLRERAGKLKFSINYQKNMLEKYP